MKKAIQGTGTQEKIFFTADRSACPILKRNQAPKFLENFQVHFVLYSQEITFLKESLPCICKYFISVRRFIRFEIGLSALISDLC